MLKFVSKNNNYDCGDNGDDVDAKDDEDEAGNAAYHSN